jgi:hypothetical protein
MSELARADEQHSCAAGANEHESYSIEAAS